jgi:hypothetical protein
VACGPGEGNWVSIMSVFASTSVEKEVKRILNIPEYMKIALASRLEYPISVSSNDFRVR